MTGTVRYSYTHAPRVVRGWGALTLGILLAPLSGLALAARGRRLPDKESVRDDVLQTALVAALFGSPWWTCHEVRPDRVILRQGLNFYGSISYRDIASVHATERKPTQFPIRLYRHTLFLALWPVDLVAIRLRRPQRFRLFHLLPVWKVREVVINVDRRDAFIQDLCARIGEAGAEG